MKELLALRPVDVEKYRPTKILDRELKKIKSFTAGPHFFFAVSEYENFHEIMEEVFAFHDCFIVLGAPNEKGRELAENEGWGVRRKKGPDATIQDKHGPELVLDIDDHTLPGYDALNPEPGIKAWLEAHGIDCDVTWQITSSQKLNTEEARLRLYMEADKPYSLQYRKAWAQSPEIGADGSVYTCSQPIYTAAPIIMDGDEQVADPIPNRTGFIKGKRRTFKLPKFEEEEIRQYSNSYRGSNYDFDSSTLPQEVLEGKVYRRYFMPLAFHYANKLKGDADAVFDIIAARAMRVRAREFDEENVRQYIDDAMRKIQDEDAQEEAEAIADDDGEELEAAASELVEIPQFPRGVIEDWPEPWPMIWDNMKRVPREFVEELLVQTVISLNAFLLHGNYVTGGQKRPNIIFLALIPSTGGKDVNSKNVIIDLNTIFTHYGGKKPKKEARSIFAGIMTGETTISSDTAFLQSFTESGELYWVNTEATNVFNQMANSGGNAAVAGLSDKLIHAFDGIMIPGKKKAGETIGTIHDPNVQILFFAQPDTIQKHITRDTVESGLFGRCQITIVPELDEFDLDRLLSLKAHNVLNIKIDDDFYRFYNDTETRIWEKNFEKKETLQVPDSEIDVFREWAQGMIGDVKEDQTLMKVFGRTFMIAEYLYCVVLGICRNYDIFKGRRPRDSIPIKPLLPLIEYWTKTKEYMVKNFIDDSFDPTHDCILSTIRACRTGKHDSKFPRAVDRNYLAVGYVNANILVSILKKDKVLKSRLEARNELRGAGNNLLTALERMERAGILIKEEDGSRKYYKIAR